MEFISKDIMTVKSGNICHQVNCQKVMGAGIALTIRKKWPNVFEEYKRFTPRLGNIQIIQVTPALRVVNCFAQDRYGRDKRYTDYSAVKECMKKVDLIWGDIYIPYMMGCSNAGGDWNVVSSIIEEYCPRAIICKPPNAT